LYYTIKTKEMCEYMRVRIATSSWPRQWCFALIESAPVRLPHDPLLQNCRYSADTLFLIVYYDMLLQSTIVYVSALVLSVADLQEPALNAQYRPTYIEQNSPQNIKPLT
jgi:hypothetical protein